MTIFMESTRVSVERTVNEIHSILSRYGVTAIMNDLLGGRVIAVSFRFPINGEDVPFRLPCKADKMQAALKREGARKRHADETDEEWARRVAWRQILRWVEAQMALVQTNMVKVEEVFLPYRQAGPSGETVFEMIEARGTLMLEAKS